MVTNINTGRDDGEGFDPLMTFMLALVLIAVGVVGFFMWSGYQSSGVHRAPTTINLKH